MKERDLSLTGDRLPTETEMEYSMRAGSSTSRDFGETEELLPKYAWCQWNALGHTWPVGSLKPNDFGLFDVQGNASTWCQKTFQAALEALVGSEKRIRLIAEDLVQHFERLMKTCLHQPE